MHKVLLVTLSAALISVKLSGAAQAAYNETDIDRMEDLISQGNWVDLRIYLLANPRLLSGSDTFTEALQRFLEQTDSLYTALTFDPSIFPDPSLATPTQTEIVANTRRTTPPTPPAAPNRPTPQNSNAASTNSNGAANASGNVPATAAIPQNSIY